MKRLLIIILMMYSSLLFSQLSINVGNDLKISTFGTDNKFTTHNAVFNYEIKLEYIDNRDTYFAIGHKYVNLKQKYNSYYFNLGVNQNISNKISLIYAIELGLLMRDVDHRDNDGVIYPQINISPRYAILSWLNIGYKFYIQLSRDITKAFRYGGNLEIICNIL